MYPVILDIQFEYILWW